MDHGVKLLVPKGQHLQTGSTGSQNHQASMVHAQLDVGIWKAGFCKAPIFIQEMPARAYANDFHTRAVISSARKHVCTLCFWMLLEHPVPTFGNQITQWQTTLDACFLDISEEPEIKSDLGRPGIQLWTMGVLCQTCRKNVTNDPRWPKMIQDDPSVFPPRKKRSPTWTAQCPWDASVSSNHQIFNKGPPLNTKIHQMPSPQQIYSFHPTACSLSGGTEASMLPLRSERGVPLINISNMTM